MSDKRKVSDTNTQIEKKQRKWCTLDVKLDIIKRAECGQRAVDIGRALNMPPTTIRTILKGADKYKQYGESVSTSTAKRLTRNRSNVMVNMERLLSKWIENQMQQCVPLSYKIIQNKALLLYENLKDDDDPDSFTASRGWFEKFKKRSQFYNFGVATDDDGNEHMEDKENDEEKESDELHQDDEISVDTKTYESCKNLQWSHSLKALIEQGGYTPQQVFTVADIGLFWKRLPSKTFIFQEEENILSGYRAGKDHLSLLLGSNAAGDFKLKPLLVYPIETPKALKGFAKRSLPVLWRSNKTGVVDVKTFEDWFGVYFCPAVENYCKINCLEHKVLLIVSDDSCYPHSLDDISENIKVIFLPQNIAAIFLPMHQGSLVAFKAYYYKEIFFQAKTVTDMENSNDSTIIRRFWNEYNIKKAIKNINEAWKKIPTEFINTTWSKIWLECVTNFANLQQIMQQVKETIIELGRGIGFEDLDLSDIDELLDSYEQFSYDDYNLQFFRLSSEGSDVSTREAEAKVISTEELAEGFRLLECVKNHFDNMDPNIERSSRIIKSLEDAITCYKEMFTEKKNVSNRLHLNNLIYSETMYIKEETSPEVYASMSFLNEEAPHSPI